MPVFGLAPAPGRRITPCRMTTKRITAMPHLRTSTGIVDPPRDVPEDRQANLGYEVASPARRPGWIPGEVRIWCPASPASRRLTRPRTSEGAARRRPSSPDIPPVIGQQQPAGRRHENDTADGHKRSGDSTSTSGLRSSRKACGGRRPAADDPGCHDAPGRARSGVKGSVVWPSMSAFWMLARPIARPSALSSLMLPSIDEPIRLAALGREFLLTGDQ